MLFNRVKSHGGAKAELTGSTYEDVMIDTRIASLPKIVVPGHF